MTRVLIVDDDVDHAESLADIIEMRGHTVQLAHSGEQGISEFRSASYDFVLLDVKLPGINGVAAFLEMKKIRPDAQVMMMTGYSVEQLVAQAIDGGALGVLHKPFAATEVLEVLSKVTRRGRVLVADDERKFVDGIVPILTEAGYNVDVAANGVEILEKMKGRNIDCLLLDMHLPVRSGAEMYARLVEAVHTVPTILLSGDHGDVENDMRLQAETCGVLFKPFDPNALLAAIGSAVSLGQTR
jgi:DNA-binding response OmpR family regulator